MNIKFLHSHLLEYLDTKATPKQIAEYLSLCGPKIEKISNDFVYSIEITTNRIDAFSVYGIAREAVAILPRFGVKAKLKRLPNDSANFVRKVNYLSVVVDSKLCPRFTAVLIKNVKIGESPEIIKTRLAVAGVRSINNVVDISNYIMLELGQPVHTFDYDKIKGSKMVLRESVKGESITTLDGKNFTLTGGDIVIEDGAGRLIDLAGIMGGNLSAVSDMTKNVLLFVQAYEPNHIRKTSMTLSQRTTAATIFEKGTDTELVAPAILKAISMFEKICKGTAEKLILDIYPNPYKPIKISVAKEFINRRLGVNIEKKEITNYLNLLEFEVIWEKDVLEVLVPSFRSNDTTDPEDVVEEVARIYGYHNLPSVLMSGNLTGRASSPSFTFEEKLKNYLSDWGGNEVYTLSLVPKEFTNELSLKLKNPLGSDGEYLRTSLMSSLIEAAQKNLGTIENFHLFEMANVYLPKKNDLPEERLMLAGIFNNYNFRSAKGIVEALVEKIGIKTKFEILEKKGFAAGKCAQIKVGSEKIGWIGYLENNDFIYYEFEVQKLFVAQGHKEYKVISKYPPQIEDITLVFPEKTKIGEVVEEVPNMELKDIFKNAYTFRVRYHNPEKTLTDSEVEVMRNKILQIIKSKFGGNLKS